MKTKRSLLAAAGLVALLAQSAWASDALPTGFKIDEAGTSVSGLSSGAFMAAQLQVAYSGSIVGAGVVAGGPYACAGDTRQQGSMANTSAMLVCMGQVFNQMGDVGEMVKTAQRYSDAGQIDKLDNLKNRRVYLFSGKTDLVVRSKAVDAAQDFFKQAGVPADNLQYVNNKFTGHALLTTNFGSSCMLNQAPYVNNCDYDQAGALLSHIYGPLKAKSTTLSGKLMKFDQRAFAAEDTTMAKDAYVYVPQSCQKEKGETCKVHVAIHGCMQGADYVGDKFIAHAGYNEWADANNMIVLYPQVNSSMTTKALASAAFDVLGLLKASSKNPAGCWDWMGYTGANYATKSAPQMQAIMSMVKALGSGAAASN